MTPAQRIEGRDASIGPGASLLRLLPRPERRTVGAWCFLDHFGPVPAADAPGVGPHPHIGLQTVTWLLAGQALHTDSVGSRQVVRPGEVALMTAGRGIAHAEALSGPDGRLHGLQLWIALPDADRACDPRFDLHRDLPRVAVEGLSVTVVLGEALGARSPARVHTPLVGLDVNGSGALPLNPAFEHAVVPTEGEVRIDGVPADSGALWYLAPGRERVAFEGGRAFVIGGVPFVEPVRLWWNFAARTEAEMAEARAGWEQGVGYGDLSVFTEPLLAAPPRKHA